MDFEVTDVAFHFVWKYKSKGVLLIAVVNVVCVRESVISYPNVRRLPVQYIILNRQTRRLLFARIRFDFSVHIEYAVNRQKLHQRFVFCTFPLPMSDEFRISKFPKSFTLKLKNAAFNFWLICDIS